MATLGVQRSNHSLSFKRELIAPMQERQSADGAEFQGFDCSAVFSPDSCIPAPGPDCILHNLLSLIRGILNFWMTLPRAKNRLPAGDFHDISGSREFLCGRNFQVFPLDSTFPCGVGGSVKLSEHLPRWNGQRGESSGFTGFRIPIRDFKISY